MKKLIHLSDLHLGTERPGLIELLVDDIAELKPDIIVASGDFTQRALHPQYLAAVKLLKRIGNNNVICVPGNHDVALYNPFERFLYPYHKYNKYIKTQFLSSYYQDGVAIVGVNSVTPFKPMSGYVTDKQLVYVRDFFNEHADAKLKLVVMHHNLIRSERHKIINDAEKIISELAACNVNLVLSGHIHAAKIEHLDRSFLAHHMYIVTAGTAISTRTTEPNSFNVIEFGEGEFKLIVREVREGRFVSMREQVFAL